MGEVQRRKAALARSLDHLRQTEPRCIYCTGPAETIEHMPPIGFFLDRQRPSGMEFAACASCNQGTRGADAVAAFVARLRPYDDGTTKIWAEAAKLQRTVNQLAPGVLEEIFDRPERDEIIWARSPSGILQKSIKMVVDGPKLRANLQTFSAKFAMALFREHAGVALPLEGYVGATHFLNAGLNNEQARVLLSVLPGAGTLRQGKKGVVGQFAYRFNHDADMTIIHAMASFHQGLHVFVVASTDPRVQDLEVTGLSNWRMSRPGQLLELLAPGRTPPPPPVSGLILPRSARTGRRS